jgi:hypothetical protein
MVFSSFKFRINFQMVWLSLGVEHLLASLASASELGGKNICASKFKLNSRRRKFVQLELGRIF